MFVFDLRIFPVFPIVNFLQPCLTFDPLYNRNKKRFGSSCPLRHHTSAKSSAWKPTQYLCESKNKMFVQEQNIVNSCRRRCCQATKEKVHKSKANVLVF